MRNKRILSIIMMMGCLVFIVGCSPTANVGVEEILPMIQQMDEVAYPEKTIIALGEATHGNREFTQLKQKIFQQLVEQQDMRVFALEGDMGGAHKVNEYTQEGKGTAQQAASEIGFAIYRTQEMVDLIEWMRSFNENRPQSDQIRFYGYDMQRYDHSKSGLFQILEDFAPELYQQYASTLNEFTDDTMYDLDTDAVEAAILELETLNNKLEEQRDIIILSTSKKEFALAQQYAAVLRQNTELLLAEADYGTKRDAYMAENVQWILEYEGYFYDNNHIFITGHNGHIGKMTATVGTEKAMGELLAKQYGDEYFAIGTEFYDSRFLASDYDTGERKAYRVTNSGNKRLAVLLHEISDDSLYLNMADENINSDLVKYLNEKQRMSSIGDMFSDSFSKIEKAYTQKIAPYKAYDGMIFLDTLTPSTMLDTK